MPLTAHKKGVKWPSNALKSERKFVGTISIKTTLTKFTRYETLKNREPPHHIKVSGIVEVRKHRRRCTT